MAIVTNSTSGPAISRGVDRTRLAALIERERVRYVASHGYSRTLFEGASHLFGRVPMTWMARWAGGFPAYLDQAHGNRVLDVDGNTYLDFALGDTGAMTGHSPAPIVAAVQERMAVEGGIATMLPTPDAEWVGGELARRFGLPLWSFSLTATDANRRAVRLARLATGRPRIAVFSHCYHGSVDETLAVPGPDGRAVPRPGSVGAPVDPDLTTRVVEFNDLVALEAAMAHGDVAAVLMEPALTNIGIVLPEPGYLDGVRRLCTRYGSLLILDETHTFSAGPGGATAAWGLRPDLLVIGKGIGGGVPAGAYGITEEVAALIARHPESDLVDVGGVGGTLAGNTISVVAMRATLEHVLTDAAFVHMIDIATAFAEGVRAVIAAAGLPWSVQQVGARVEYRFTAPAPRTGGESAARADDDLDEYLHLFLMNRGVLTTPFHNMALMCPDTTAEDVATHIRLFAQAVDELLATGPRG